MNKIILVVVILAIIIVALIGVLIFIPGKVNNKSNPVIGTDGLQINGLVANQEISSPLKITGNVTGNGWGGFEGQVGIVKLLDAKGDELVLGILTATTEWTTLPTNFETTLNFISPSAQSGTLVFHNENASGLPEKDKTFVLPVKIKASGEMMTVKAYFGKSGVTEVNCTDVVAVDRTIIKTQSTAKSSIEELLKGPTDLEKLAGFSTSIPAGSKLNSISIVNGEARADFDETTESGGGSCSMASRVAQIKQTLLQFSTITSIKLSINGRTGDIFQP